MKVKLVFNDWRLKGSVISIYNTPLGVELSMGDLHSGTTFDAELNINSETENEIKEALKQGAYPVFAIFVNE
jgi:hypothetical protein